MFLGHCGKTRGSRDKPKGLAAYPDRLPRVGRGISAGFHPAPL
jgi:hypothetical protein